MFPLRLFETFPVEPTLKPLLIGEKAMEYYNLRTGTQFEFLIPKEEFQRLRLHVSEGSCANAFGDAGIQIGGYTLYASQFGLLYFQLERGAIDQDDYLVVHLELLLFLTTLTLVHESGNQKARYDQMALIARLGMLPDLSQSRREVDPGETGEKQ